MKTLDLDTTLLNFDKDNLFVDYKVIETNHKDIAFDEFQGTKCIRDDSTTEHEIEIHNAYYFDDWNYARPVVVDGELRNQILEQIEKEL